MHTPTPSSPSVAQSSLLPKAFAALLFSLVFLVPFLARQPKAVSAAVYSAYVAVMALAAGVIFAKQGRRGMAIGSAVVGVAFGCLCGFYAFGA